MSKVFLDTNLLVYCMDGYDKRKRDACRKLVAKIQRDGKGVISTQVLQEFFVAATKKLRVDALLAKEIMHGYGNFEVITVNPEMIADAIDCCILNRLSFWDSLIIVAAESAQCTELWTEDLNPGQVIRGVKIVNPIS